MAFAAETSALFSPGSGISLDRGWRGKRKLFPLGSVKRAFRGVTVRCVADLKCYNDSLTIKHQAEKRDDFLYGYSASRNNICNISFGFGSERQSVMKHKKFLSTRLIPPPHVHSNSFWWWSGPRRKNEHSWTRNRRWLDSDEKENFPWIFKFPFHGCNETIISWMYMNILGYLH